MSEHDANWWIPPAAPQGVTPKTAASDAISVDRRTALKLMALGSALALPACSPPPEKIVPYVNTPEGLVPGIPRHYASMLPLLGSGLPVIVECHEGLPIKIEGNSSHVASGSAADAFAQASVLSLYDPERTTAPRRRGHIKPWRALTDELDSRRRTWARDGGRGLHLLTGAVTSPTLVSQITGLTQRFPEARWHCWEPINEDNARKGAEIAYGRPLDTLAHLNRAERLVVFDADPLGPGPAQVRHARNFSDARRARARTDRFARVYAIESAMTLTGAVADHRLALAPKDIGAFARALAHSLGSNDNTVPPLPKNARQSVDAIAEDLLAHRGRALVMAGRTQPPEIHALVHWINTRLQAYGRTAELVRPVDAGPAIRRESIEALAEALAAGKVTDLIVLDGNPAYDSPADIGFERLMAEVPFSLHMGTWANETTARCTWHTPLSHPLESWSDAKTADGTTGIVQPVIRPLHDSRTMHELVAMLAGEIDPSSHDIVRTYWRERHHGDDFEEWWRRVLRVGAIPDSAPQTASPGAPHRPALETPATTEDKSGTGPGRFTVVFRPDASIWDGRFAGNAWLQELPRPFSSLVWNNAAGIAPSDAETLQLKQGDVIRMRCGEATVDIPVVLAPGQAPGVIALPLGYGRTQAGAIGTGVGTDVYPLRQGGDLWVRTNVTLEMSGTHYSLAQTQHHHQMEGRDIVRTTTADELRDVAPRPAESPSPASPYPDWNYEEHAWAMVIDQSACIGCNACVAACQAENNTPVVGPEEISRGRDMHWLRVDTYYRGTADAPDTMFQPVPCMHCEKAPCEPVCPVEASVHDSEGLNAQVYNRCIGTRFCQANCPYQVRRFNFYGYGNGQEYANLGAESYHLMHNPDVTVRSRGVMEKCTYCVQRISRARKKAKQEDRPLREGDVVTACQAACPTQAIHFGDLNTAASTVNALRREPHEYALLGHLGTRPRTTYLARAHNPNPRLSGGNVPENRS